MYPDGHLVKICAVEICFILAKENVYVCCCGCFQNLCLEPLEIIYSLRIKEPAFRKKGISHLVGCVWVFFAPEVKSWVENDTKFVSSLFLGIIMKGKAERIMSKLAKC